MKDNLTRNEVILLYPGAVTALMAEANEQTAHYSEDEDGNLVASWTHISGSSADAVMWNPESKKWE